jgi:hypothetical protein
MARNESVPRRSPSIAAFHGRGVLPIEAAALPSLHHPMAMASDLTAIDKYPQGHTHHSFEISNSQMNCSLSDN